MAKKKKKKNNAKLEENINEMLMSTIEPEAPAPASEKPEEDEFEALLRSFINSDGNDDKDEGFEYDAEQEIDANDQQQTLRQEIVALNLGNDENELAMAYANLLDAITAIAENNGIEMPSFFFDAESLSPNYKPSIGRKIVADAMYCWDILFQAYPDRLQSLKPSASDEEFLNFAESISDQNLQLSIISYVEILIDIENCEISYEQRRLKAQRRRIERQLYEEYQRRQETRKRFIEAVEKKRFPVNAERLITNYFKTATKDAKGAFEVLTTNPAVYAPIEINKIKPRFFGLIKVTPKDGIRENQRLAEFLRKLRA